MNLSAVWTKKKRTRLCSSKASYKGPHVGNIAAIFESFQIKILLYRRDAALMSKLLINYVKFLFNL